MTTELLRSRVDKALQDFLRTATPPLGAVSADLVPFGDAIEAFVLDGGKRLRPAFCYWGYRAVADVDSDALVRSAAALELVQAGALMHDDVIDRSDTRRGAPAVHRRFAAHHRASGWTGDPEAFGQAAAILLGDLALVWADSMLATSGLPGDALARAQPVWEAMRVEVMCGQYLDVVEQARGGGSVERALRVARYKSAKYTVERPLHLGATLAGGGAALLDGLGEFGLAIGEAFQLRDDLLGVFGDPDTTGKPAGDDLREGKRTVLVAVTLDRGTDAQRGAVRERLGDPALDDDGVSVLREVITSTGAVDEIESMIDDRVTLALCALDATTMRPDAAEALRTLAIAATSRRG